MPNGDAAPNGRGRLEEAVAMLIQAQAALSQTQAAFLSQLAELERRSLEYRREADERFAQIIRVLNEHSRLLERLPDAVRDKIGFKGRPGAGE
jgi:hypothetical protein